MLNNYYTLNQIVKYLQQYIGYEAIACFSQEKDSLIIVLAANNEPVYFQFSLKSNLTGLMIPQEYSRAKKNTIDLLDCIIGDVLQSVQLFTNDRIIELDFINTKIYAVLYGASKNNIIVLDKKSNIIDAYKNKKELIGSKFSYSSQCGREIHDFSDDTAILKALAFSKFNFGKYYAAQICDELNISKQSSISEFCSEDLIKISQYAEQFAEKLNLSQEYFVLNNESDDVVFSLIKLNSHKELIFSSRDLAEVMLKRFVSTLKKQDFSKAFQKYKSFLENSLRKLEKSLAAISKLKNEPQKKDEEYRLSGELLISQANVKSKGLDEIEVYNYSGQLIKINLEKNLTIMENAEKYFEKARKYKENLKHKVKQLPKIQEKYFRYKKKLEDLNNISTLKEINKFNKELKETFGKEMNNQEENRESKFRQFDLGEGFVLYVGKNAANNDELTMRFAKPNDLWFHARGSSGSHAVMPLGKDQKPPKQILQKAANISAYYSGSRNAKYTPVSYTFKKYVRKPKGANPGSVVIAREEVIMAEPKLPEGYEE